AAGLCGPLTRAIAEPPAAGGPPGSVSAGIWKSRRDSRSGPAIVKMKLDGGVARRVAVVRPDSRRQVTTSPGVNGKSGRNVSVRRSLDRRSLPSCEPDTDPLMTSGAPPVIEPASTIPPGRRMTFVSGRIQEEPGSGERNSRSGDCASTPDAGYTNIDAATGIATTRTRVRRVIEGDSSEILATTYRHPTRVHASMRAQPYAFYPIQAIDSPAVRTQLAGLTGATVEFQGRQKPRISPLS